jgi:RHS repeat-associated protein
VDVASLPGTIPTVSIYTFDASDNRIEFRVEQEDLAYRYVVDDADNLTEIHLTDGTDPEVLIETLEADEDGNLVTRTNELTNEVITYGWDDHDRLVKVSSAISGTPTSTVKEHNRYGVDGIRKRKLDRNGNASSEYTAGISTAVDKAGTSSTKPTISYIMGAGQILGYEEGNGNFRYFLPDALGTVRDIVDDSGAVVQSYEFDPHGVPMPGSGAGSVTSAKTYHGGLSVNDDTADSGLFLMGHRHWMPEHGRFISRDPIGFRGGLNLYGAAFGNNPVTFVDPSGLLPSPGVLPGSVPMPPAPSVDTAQIQKSIQMIEQLGYPEEAAYLKAELASGDLSGLPGFMRGGFTNPFTKNIGLNAGDCASGTGKENFVYLTGLLFHEARHARSQSGPQLLTQGVAGHWLGIPTAAASLEIPIYQDELDFLRAWKGRARGGPDTIIPELNQRIGKVKADIAGLKNAAACQGQYRTEEYPFGLYK